MVGYTGGKNPNPTYESVCSGDGHTEALRITYDPQQVTYEELLDVFYNSCPAHSGGKVQYKSAIWVHNEEQRAIAEDSVAKRYRTGRLQVMDAEPWHDAEEYHQKYYKKNGCSVQ